MDFKDLRRACRYRAGRFLVEGTSRLPIPVGRSLYGFLGRMAFSAVRRDRRIAIDNLRHAHPDWPEAELLESAEGVFEELVRNIYDVAAFARWTEDVKVRELRLSGAEHLDRALSEGRGAILLGNHQGAWELVPVALSRAGYSLEAFSRPIAEPRLDRWLTEHRKRLGVTTLPRNGLSAALRARRLLRKGRIVAVLLDHRIRKGGQMVEFFGRPARFALGPIRLALRSGAPIVPVRIGRDSEGRHHVEIGAALARPDASLSSREATAACLGTCVRELEDMIRRSPSEWAWLHPRWGRPEESVPERRPAVARATGAFAILIAALVSAMLGCETQKPSTDSPAQYTGPSSAIGGFELSETDAGRLKWILRADSASTYDNTNHETVVVNPHVDFYNGKREIYSVLTAEKGIVQESTNDMSASGNVRIVTQGGDTLTTETLQWQSAPGRVRTTDKFRLARPDVVLTGTGFESDPDLKNYRTEDVQIDARGGKSTDARS